eukprot:10389520-Lingulodinium_polyedra.AAC.1
MELPAPLPETNPLLARSARWANSCGRFAWGLTTAAWTTRAPTGSDCAPAPGGAMASTVARGPLRCPRGQRRGPLAT